MKSEFLLPPITAVLNPFDPESQIFQENWVNIIAADALATQGARTSLAMVLTVYDKIYTLFLFYYSYMIHYK